MPRSVQLHEWCIPPASATLQISGFKNRLWETHTWCIFCRLQNVVEKGWKCTFLIHTLNCFKFLSMCDWTGLSQRRQELTLYIHQLSHPPERGMELTGVSCTSSVLPQMHFWIGEPHWTVTKSIAHDKGCGSNGKTTYPGCVLRQNTNL